MVRASNASKMNEGDPVRLHERGMSVAVVPRTNAFGKYGVKVPDDQRQEES